MHRGHPRGKIFPNIVRIVQIWCYFSFLYECTGGGGGTGSGVATDFDSSLGIYMYSLTQSDSTHVTLNCLLKWAESAPVNSTRRRCIYLLGLNDKCRLLRESISAILSDGNLSRPPLGDPWDADDNECRGHGLFTCSRTSM